MIQFQIKRTSIQTVNAVMSSNTIQSTRQASDLSTKACYHRN